MRDFLIRKEKVAARGHQPPMTQSAAGQKRLVSEFRPKMTGPIVATEKEGGVHLQRNSRSGLVVRASLPFYLFILFSFLTFLFNLISPPKKILLSDPRSCRNGARV